MTLRTPIAPDVIAHPFPLHHPRSYHAVNEDLRPLLPRIRAGDPCGICIRRQPGQRAPCFLEKHQQQGDSRGVPEIVVQAVSCDCSCPVALSWSCFVVYAAECL